MLKLPCTLIWLKVFNISVNHSCELQSETLSLYVLSTLAVVLTLKNIVSQKFGEGNKLLLLILSLPLSGMCSAACNQTASEDRSYSCISFHRCCLKNKVDANICWEAL